MWWVNYKSGKYMNVMGDLYEINSVKLIQRYTNV